MTERPARLKLYGVSAMALVQSLYTANARHITDGIPPGAELREAGYNRERGVFELVVQHDSFPVVVEGEPLPRGSIEAESLGGEY